jgi:uncharacterized repeat protein (TIGR01451 family)
MMVATAPQALTDGDTLSQQKLPVIGKEAPSLEAATATLTRQAALKAPELSGVNEQEHRYIIQFVGDAVPLAIAEQERTFSSTTSSEGRLDLKSAQAQAYVDKLRDKQSKMLAQMSTAGAIEVLRTHQHAVNAAIVRMTPTTAKKVMNMPGVAFVERDQAVELNTPTSVPFIGADRVWDGSATEGVPYLGEGTVVGIIDSGINHSHPSFAATGADGFTITNPLGEGNYLGECQTISGLCNSKLIGAYTFLDGQTSDPADEVVLPGDAPSVDTDGHGTHVASTAAGSVVANVALEDVEGNPSSVVFDAVSGVAPHANIVAYKVCAPSCFFVDIVSAVDQAIEDGVVDVLNHSIGSPAGSPWNSSQATAFLNARIAGIFVSNSAGNSGPAPATATAAGNAPWVAGVAATTHPRSFPSKELNNLSGGDTTPPADITGRAASGGITGEIVYAGDFFTENGSENDSQPEQCLDPFPAGTFTSSQIVLCDRGAIARVAKGQNVRDGGAGGFILGNTAGGNTSVNDDLHVIPAIHINAADADAMRSWLASGSGHTGTITAVDSPISDPAAGDNLANFSSRGPYTDFDILAPNTAAPGANIFAAGAELTPEQVALIATLYAGTSSETPAVPGKYGAISGTSMSSPHIAGTAALLKQANPDWTDAEVLSAIMTTGTWDLVKEDGVTQADPFDFGGGRVRIDQAINAPLLLDETGANFIAANPASGGDPKTLNTAGLVNQQCAITCSWTRTLTADESGTWNTSTSSSAISVSPTSFSLAAGDTQEIVVTVDSASLPNGEWVHGRVNLLPTVETQPDQHLTISVVPVGGELPEEIAVTASRDADSFLVQGLTASEITDLQVSVSGLVRGNVTGLSLSQDSDNTTPFDDLSDGVDFVLLATQPGPARVIAFTEDETSESPDVDLYLGFDANGNGLPDADELICSSNTLTAAEQCEVTGVSPGGDFWVLVQNWGASTTPPDAVALTTAVVNGADEGNLTVTGPSSVSVLTPFDLRLTWDLSDASAGDVFFGSVTLGTDASNPSSIGTIPVTITRGANDVVYSVDSETASPGDTLTFSVEVAANFTPEDRNYAVSADIPEGFTLVPGSVSGGGVVSDNSISWDVTMISLLAAAPGYEVTTSMETPSCAVPFANRGGYVDLEQFGILPQATIEGDSITFSAFANQNFNFFGESFVGTFNATDDGFAFFDPAIPGAVPFINQSLPDVADPNKLIAGLWRDFVIPTPNSTPGSIVGVTLATAGPNLSIIEYDNLELWPGGGGDSVDFQMAIRGLADDTPGVFEIMVAFDNVQTPQGFGTIGVENADGTSGTQYAYNDVAISDGMAVCFNLVGPSPAPAVLTYQVTVDASAAESVVTSTASNAVDSIGSQVVEEALEVTVGPAPLRGDINGDGIIDRADLMLVLAARNTLADGPNDPRDLNGDGIINVLDARLVVLECTLPRCATPG